MANYLNAFDAVKTKYFSSMRLPGKFWKPDIAEKIHIDLINRRLFIHKSLKLTKEEYTSILQWVLSIIRGLTLRDYDCHTMFTVTLSDVTDNLIDGIQQNCINQCGANITTDEMETFRRMEELEIYFAGRGVQLNKN